MAIHKLPGWRLDDDATKSITEGYGTTLSRHIDPSTDTEQTLNTCTTIEDNKRTVGSRGWAWGMMGRRAIHEYHLLSQERSCTCWMCRVYEAMNQTSFSLH